MSKEKDENNSSGKLNLPNVEGIANEDTVKRTNATTAPPAPPSVFELFQDMKRNNSTGSQRENASSSAQSQLPESALKSEKKGHERMVSWGAIHEDQKPGMVDRSASDVLHDLKAQTSPNSQSRVTIDDVVQHTPIENEVQTDLIRHLEHNEEESGSGVLHQMSDDAASALMGRTIGSHRTDSLTRLRSLSHDLRRAPSSALGKVAHRRTETMEAKLSNLCEQLDEIHLIHQQDTGDPILTPFQRDRINTLDSHMNNEEHIQGSADAFSQNAGFLYHRARKEELDKPSSIVPGDGSSIDSTLSGNRSASERWRKLRTTTMFSLDLKHNSEHTEPGAGDVIDPKKTDEAIPEVDEDDYRSDIEMANSVHSKGGRNRKMKKQSSALFREWRDFYSFRQGSFRLYIKILFFYMMAPLIGIAAFLFYFVDNTPTGRLANNGLPINGTIFVEKSDGTLEEFTKTDTASASYWLLYISRQILTFSLAKLVEFVFIDFLSIRSGRTVKYFGPWATLFLLQSRGWPFLVFVWGLLDFGLMTGARPFFAHWGFWQDAVDLFNRANPSGGITVSDWNSKILATAICIGVVVAIKRFWVGLYLGRKTFSLYSDQLTALMKKIILISKVASLGRDIERRCLSEIGYESKSPSFFGVGQDQLDSLLNNAMDELSNTEASNPKSHLNDEPEEMKMIIDPSERHPLTGSLLPQQKAKVARLLGAWEEPTIAEKQGSQISVDALLQFRRALACLKTSYPFSGSFGLCDKRESCIERAQETYYRLMLTDPEAKYLDFDTLAILGISPDTNEVDKEVVKDLIRLFRPGRDGGLALIDFVKAVDMVYKDIRTLRASVANATKIDHSFESLFNIVFYAIITTIVLSQLGFDPLALFLSVSGVVLAFAFMIGSASSKYFEGILFILARRPYQIGDGIHIGNVERNTDITGSGFWTVTDVSLFSTSVQYLFTGERATYSNGSLANSRIINATRSLNANLLTFIKIPLNVDAATLQLFTIQVREFMHNRPREWLTFDCVRAINLDIARGFMEYVIVGKHRSSWADWGDIHESKAQLMSFVMELQQKMGIYYRPPPLPIDLNQSGRPTNVYEFPPDRPAVPPLSTAAPVALGDASDADMEFLNKLTNLQQQYMPKD